MKGEGYQPDSTACRHPDEKVMRKSVIEKRKFYEKQQARIKAANLPFEPEAGLIDELLRDAT